MVVRLHTSFGANLGSQVHFEFLMGAENARLFEANKLKLVVSKIPRLGGVEYLFKEFYTAAPAPLTPDELQYVMDHMANSWMELACGCGNAMDTFRTTTIRCPEDDGFEAEGVVATYFDGSGFSLPLPGDPSVGLGQSKVLN